MALRNRGILAVVIALIGIATTIADGADDGFSFWNGVGLVCFIALGLYGFSYIAQAERA